MKITWLGQNGLLFETGGLALMIDPYLSDSVAKIDAAKHRRVPVDARFLKCEPDIIICTHDHLDHTDPDTLPIYLKREKRTLVFVPQSAFQKLLGYGRLHNYVCAAPHTEWTEGDIRISFVRAEHSEPFAVGVILEAEGKRYYITGDTLYNTDVLNDITAPVDVLFLPINGVGNNMNIPDAERFAAKIGAKHTVPVHWGLFDNLNPTAFQCEGRIIPEFFKEIPNI